MPWGNDIQDIMENSFLLFMILTVSLCLLKTKGKDNLYLDLSLQRDFKGEYIHVIHNNYSDIHILPFPGEFQLVFMDGPSHFVLPVIARYSRLGSEVRFIQ